MALAAVASCEAFDKTAVQDITAPVPDNTANVRFFNFGVNTPGVNFYSGTTKITAISSTTGAESTTGVAYGAASSGERYTAVAAGTHTFSGKIAATVDKDLAVSSIPATLEAGKFYSVYQSGFYNTTAKTIDGFIVEDNFTKPTNFTVASVRFVHAISNAGTIQLYARNTTTTNESAVGAAIAYKAASAYVELPAGVYDLRTVVTGSTNAFVRAAVSFNPGKVYTVTARGDITVVSTTATNRPFLDVTANW